MSASAMLIIGGAGSLILSFLTLYQALPRDGKPMSAWTRTETRAMGTAILVMLLLVAGGTMLAKAFL
jgi:hypothetical protein